MRPLPLLALLVALLVAAPAALAQTPAPPGTGQTPAPPGTGQAPAPKYRPTVPSDKTLYDNGNDGRFLVDGAWLFRRDLTDEGVRRKFYASTSAAGWSQVGVPHDWTAGDLSIASMAGGVGWYRKDFRLPDRASGLTWLARFESVNYRATIYLNGREVGEHAGASLPFEVALRGLKRTGVNRLVVRVDSRRLPSDLPPGGNGADGLPRGGWWNASGLLREVYLRRVDQVDVQQVQVTPTLATVSGPARVAVAVTLHNWSGSRQTVALKGTYGSVPVKLGSTSIAPGGDRLLKRTVTVRKPKLWSPPDPKLYRVRFTGTTRAGGAARAIEGYTLRSGIRQIKVTPDGRLSLNGKILHLRGFGLHEDNVLTGAAVTDQIRDQYVAWTKELGATIIRGHYPFSPYLQEQADRKGILLWSEVPVWSVESQYLERPSVREEAFDVIRQNIATNGNHPSILTWSIGNELTSQPGPAEEAYIGGAAKVVKKLDPTRPVTLALIGYPPDTCRRIYKVLDLVGVNTYFGWYPGPVGQTADAELLSQFLDQIRGCYPKKPVMVTEFGAEGNRSGPPEEKGTYEFQADYLRSTLAVLNSKPYLAGAIYWTLQAFRVRPGYIGGDPRGEAPWHQKGPLDRFGNKRPVFSLLQQAYTSTQQFTAQGPPR